MFLNMAYSSPLPAEVRADAMKCIGKGSFLSAVRCNTSERRAKVRRVVTT